MASSESLITDQRDTSDPLESDMGQEPLHDIPNLADSAPLFDPTLAGHANYLRNGEASGNIKDCTYLAGMEALIGTEATNRFKNMLMQDVQLKAQKTNPEHDARAKDITDRRAKESAQHEKVKPEPTKVQPEAETETKAAAATPEETITNTLIIEHQSSVQEPQTVELTHVASQPTAEVQPQAETTMQHETTPDLPHFDSNRVHEQSSPLIELVNNTPSQPTLELVDVRIQDTLQPIHVYNEMVEISRPTIDIQNDPVIAPQPESRIDLIDPIATKTTVAEVFKTSIETAPTFSAEFAPGSTAETDSDNMINDSEISDEEMDTVIGRWVAEFEASGTIDVPLELPKAFMTGEMEPMAESTIVANEVIAEDLLPSTEATLEVVPSVESAANELSNHIEALEPEAAAEVHQLLAEAMDEIQAIQKTTLLESSEAPIDADSPVTQTENVGEVPEIQIDTAALEDVMQRLCKSAGLNYGPEEIRSLVRQLVQEARQENGKTYNPRSADWGTHESLQGFTRHWLINQIRSMSRQTNSLHRMVNRVGEYALLSLHELQAA